MRRFGLPALLATASITLLAGHAWSQTGQSTPSNSKPAAMPSGAPGGSAEPRSPEGRRYLAQPLTTEIYTADPSARVFNGKIYIYPSHDIDAGIPDDDIGSQYDMRDYRVLSMDRPGAPVTVHPVAISVKDVPWAAKQAWAPDALFKNGTYYLYMPLKDKAGVFRMGVATSKSPVGPFVAEKQPIRGSFSIDPGMFTDDDGQNYMYFGGIWGGQLQRWATGKYDAAAGNTDLKQDDKPALAPKMARLSADMKQFAEPVRDVVLLDEAGKPILGGDHDRRFFEAAWVFKRDGKYYFTYSTGDTHFLNYAIGDTPYGPFRYTGHILAPVQGWTSHHSVFKFENRWWLAYHDTHVGKKNSLRSVKMTEVFFNPDGTIRQIDPFKH